MSPRACFRSSRIFASQETFGALHAWTTTARVRGRPPWTVRNSGWEEIAWPVALALKQSLDVNPALLIPNARNDPTPLLFISMPRAPLRA